MELKAALETLDDNEAVQGVQLINDSDSVAKDANVKI